MVALSYWREVVRQLLAECSALEEHMLPAVSRRTPEYYIEEADDADAEGQEGEADGDGEEDSDTENESTPKADAELCGTGGTEKPVAKQKGGGGARTLMARTPLCVVVCSWRTVREVSLLLAQLTCITVPTPASDGCINSNTSISTTITTLAATTTLLADAQILTIGSHFARLLLVARHMGAFESGYIGFLKFSSFLWRYFFY